MRRGQRLSSSIDNEGWRAHNADNAREHSARAHDVERPTQKYVERSTQKHVERSAHKHYEGSAQKFINIMRGRPICGNSL